MLNEKRESRIEGYLNRQVVSRGGKSCKFVSPGLRGVQDRIVLKQGGQALFVELKRLGEELGPLQKKRKQEMESLGFRVYVLDSKQAVDGFIREEFP